MKLVALTVLLCLGAPAAAGAGTVLRLRHEAPSDVELVWASTEPGPFAVLRREVPAGMIPADVLPLDPAADLFVANATSPHRVPGGAVVGADVTVVYQVVGAATCSNAGVVASLPEPAPSRTDGETLVLEDVAWPRSSGLPDARSVLTTWGEIRAIRRKAAGFCGSESMRRLADGTLIGDNFALAGVPVTLEFETPLRMVVVGASLPGVAPIPVPTPVDPCANVQELVTELPATTRWRSSLELLCGPDAASRFPSDEQDDWAMGCEGGGGLHAGRLIIVSRHDPGAETRVALQGVTQFGRFMGSRWAHGPGFALRVTFSSNDGWSRTFDLQDAGDAPGCRCPDGDGDGEDDCTEALDGTDPADAASHGRDSDQDGLRDALDACPLDADPAQIDGDADGRGDACDPCPSDPSNECIDDDGDGAWDHDDNCPSVSNPDQANGDHDAIGYACDPCPFATGWSRDGDADGCPDAEDACPLVPDDGADADADGLGDACDCNDFGTVGSRPREVTVRLRSAVGRIEATWEPDPAFTGSVFDVVSGSLADLHADRSFQRAGCEDAGLTATGHVLTPGGPSSWLLVRERSSCASGSYGRSSGPAGATLRGPLDAGVPACP